MMASKQIAFLLALIAGGIAMYPVRNWLQGGISRNVSRAPGWLALLGIGVLGVGFALAAADLVPLATVTTTYASIIIVAVIWGWVRHHRSPHLRRWEASWKQINPLLESDDLDAADKVLTATHREDDAERDQLRATALEDKRAALEFQRRTKSELRAWNQTAALFARTVRTKSSQPPAGAAVFAARRQKLEAELEWIREVLSGPSGAA